DREPDAIEGEFLPSARRMPRHMIRQKPLEKPGIPRVGYVGGGLDDESGTNPRHHRREPAEVIGMSVGDHRDPERPDSVSLQERSDDSAPGVRAFASGPCIHEQPVSGRGPDGGGIALPDVEKM